MVSDETPSFLPFRSRWALWEATAIQRADLVVVVSSWLRDRLAALGIDPARILVNPNGANVEHFNPERWRRNPDLLASWGIPPDAFVFGYVGGMEAFRKLPLLVTKFAEFAAGYPRAHLVLIGNGPEQRRVRAVIARLPNAVRRRIRLPSVIPYNEVPAAMACFDCGVFPFSNPYGSPQKLFEYLAMALPVIAPDVPAVREILPDRFSMPLASQDGSDLIKLLRQAMDNPARNMEIARLSSQLARREFPWDANARRLYAYLAEHSEAPGR